MRFSQLIENKDTLYHGDHYGTTVLDPKWMIHEESNNLEGVGIYFSPDIEVARAYGPKICSISKKGLKIVESRKVAIDYISLQSAAKFTKALNETSENFWYIYSDYGLEVTGPDEVKDFHHRELQEMMLNEEIRNWQIELAERSGNVYAFVDAWNKFIKIDGLYEKSTQFYSIINTKVKVTPVNF